MQTLKTLSCVFADGSTPSDGSSSLAPKAQPFKVPLGIDLKIPLAFRNADKTIPDITGYTIIFTLREPTTRTVLLARTIPSGDIDGPAGEAFVTIDRSDTSRPSLAASLDEGSYDVIAIDTGTPAKTWRVLEPSSWYPVPSNGDAGGPWTPPASATILIGVPAPLPSYNADLVVFGGVVRWRQKERAKATFTGAAAQVAVTWPTFATRPYEVRISSPRVTDSAGPVSVDAINVTATGCTVEASDLFTGEVDLEIEEVLS